MLQCVFVASVSVLFELSLIFSLFLAAVVAVNLWRFAARYVSGKKVDSAEGERDRERERGIGRV